MTFTRLLAFALSAGTAATVLSPSDAYAQRRRVVRAPVRSVVVVGAYYRPFFYDPWYYPYYPYGLYGPFPPYAYGGQFGFASSVRLQVEPKDAEVFVDGYYAGRVDDFDGFFQRLRLEAGEHEIELYREGHRSIKQRLYLQPGETYRIRHDMQPLQPGETPDPKPTPPPAPAPGSTGRAERPSPGGPYGPGPSGRVPRTEERRGESRTEYGTLAIRIQPRDAEVRIDGELWDTPEGSDRLVVEVPAGRHRVEIRREGHDAYDNDVDVRRGETTTLNVSLRREDL